MSRLFIVAGVVVAALAVVGAPVAYALSWYEFTVLFLALQGAVVVAVALDIQRRVRMHIRRSNRWQGDTDRRINALSRVQQPRARADVATHEDLVGTVRVIQARYEGRLDRAQTSLNEAVRVLRTQVDPSLHPTPPEHSGRADQRQ